MLAWLLLVGTTFLELAGPGEAHVLAVPYRNQLDGTAYAQANCGPTSLAMVLAYYGIDASPWDLRVKAMQAQHSWVDDEGGYSDRYGVFIYNLAAVAERMGVHVSGLWRHEGTRIDRLREWQAADLRAELANGHPLIAQVAYRALPTHNRSTYLADHYIVLHGTVGGDFVYSDPLGSGNSGPDQTISERDLLTAMSQADSPRAAFAVVNTRS